MPCLLCLWQAIWFYGTILGLAATLVVDHLLLCLADPLFPVKQQHGAQREDLEEKIEDENEIPFGPKLFRALGGFDCKSLGNWEEGDCCPYREEERTKGCDIPELINPKISKKEKKRKEKKRKEKKRKEKKRKKTEKKGERFGVRGGVDSPLLLFCDVDRWGNDSPAWWSRVLEHRGRIPSW